MSVPQHFMLRCSFPSRVFYGKRNIHSNNVVSSIWVKDVGFYFQSSFSTNWLIVVVFFLFREKILYMCNRVHFTMIITLMHYSHFIINIIIIILQAGKLRLYDACVDFELSSEQISGRPKFTCYVRSCKDIVLTYIYMTF